ncbi:MAG: phage tail tube protein [Polynucleobacter sp.]
MAKLYRKRTVLVKAESTYGTDSTPAGSDAVQVRNLEITPVESEVLSRDLVRTYLGNSPQLIANTRVTVTFEVEYAGSGTAGTAPRYGSLLKACGFSETVVASTSVTYAPVSTSFSSVTIYYSTDGVRHKVTGARGTFSINLNANQIPVINFTMTGQYNAPTDTADPTTTFTNQAAPQIFNDTNTTAFTIFSETDLPLQTCTLDLGNEVVYRELVNSDKEVTIVNRAANGSLVIEMPTLASHDFFADAVAGTTGNLSIVHGTNAGNIITLASAANAISLGNPSYSEDQGVVMLNLPYTLVPSSSGNDEFTLAYT